MIDLISIKIEENQDIQLFTKILDEVFHGNCPIGSLIDEVFDCNVSVGKIEEVATIFLIKWSKYRLGSDEVDGWKSITERFISLLRNVLHTFPYNSNLWMILTKILIQRKQYDQTDVIVRQCLSYYPDLVPMYLLQAQMDFNGGHLSNAKMSLERSLSIELEIRHDPLYKFLRGSISLQEVSDIC